MVETTSEAKGSRLRAKIKFTSEILQVVGVVCSAIWVAFTYADNSRTQNDATIRELRRPYQQKKLDLYVEASRVVAHLSAIPNDPDRAKTEARFWELYWGDLALVQSTPFDENGITMQYSVQRLMSNFCYETFTKEQCGIRRNDSKQRAGVDFVMTASREVKTQWGDNAMEWLVGETPYLQKTTKVPDSHKAIMELFSPD